MAATILKKTTGLTGLAVAKLPHHKLDILYNKILKALAKMPEDAAYRKYTETIVQQRLALVQSEKSLPELETKINAGQIEEVILQAENELMLARKMVTWRPWEPLVAEPPHNQWKWPM